MFLHLFNNEWLHLVKRAGGEIQADLVQFAHLEAFGLSMLSVGVTKPPIMSFCMGSPNYSFPKAAIFLKFFSIIIIQGQCMERT